MRRIFAIIAALITGGLSVAMTNAVEVGYAVTSNATNMTNATMSGSISALASN
jgi:hypothetical protein